MRTRAKLASILILVPALALGACKDKAAIARADSLALALSAANAERDSLSTIIVNANADRDRAMQQVIDATRFADQVDAELRQVRGLTSRVGVTSSDESGKSQAAASQKDVLDRLSQLRRQLSARQAQVRAMMDTLASLRAESSAAATLLADLNTRLAARERDIAAAQEELRLLRAENVQLASDKAVLTDTVRAMDVRENRVFFVIGTRKELLQKGVVTEEGGSRGLLVVKLGKTLVPSRTLEPSAFTLADRREVITIPLPRADRAYRIVSRHDVALMDVAKKEKDGSFRGEAIRITDPAAFWAPSRYLIISEK